MSDYDMPDPDGLNFLELVRGGNPDVPFTLYAEKGSEEITNEAISRG